MAEFLCSGFLRFSERPIAARLKPVHWPRRNVTRFAQESSQSLGIAGVDSHQTLILENFEKNLKSRVRFCLEITFY
jgi:hypothetical protein